MCYINSINPGEVIAIGYKLVAVDVDGTLLDSKGRLSEETLREIRRVNSEGILFVVSSGRPGIGVRRFDFIREIDSPSILCNGAVIADLNRNKILYNCGLEKADAEKLIKMGLSFDTAVFVWSGDDCFCNVLNEKTVRYKNISGVEPILFRSAEELIDREITKILWYDEVETVKKFMDILSREQFESVSWCTSNPAFLELVNSRVSKARAMEKIGELYDIKPEEMIAIGDGENDLSMIEYAGLGVAMGNASDYVKERASYITDTNDENGVAKVLRKFCR